MDEVTDTRIRDNKPSVIIREASYEALHCRGGRVSRSAADSIYVRVMVGKNPRHSWWDLDDLMKAVCRNTIISCSGILGEHWMEIARNEAPYVVAAFDAVGELETLQFMGTA